MALIEGLVIRHPEGLSPLPGIAKDWDISNDGKEYTFYLRDAKWSNGDTVQTATNLSTGNYVVTVTDINGCMAVSSAVFLDQPIEVNSNPFPSSTSCPGGMDGSVTLDVWGGAGDYTFNSVHMWDTTSAANNSTYLAGGSLSILWPRDA